VSAAKWALKQVQGDEEGFETVPLRHPSFTRHAELVSASIVPIAPSGEEPGLNELVGVALKKAAR
jgi:hypothetical protein